MSTFPIFLQTTSDNWQILKKTQLSFYLIHFPHMIRQILQIFFKFYEFYYIYKHLKRETNRNTEIWTDRCIVIQIYTAFILCIYMYIHIKYSYTYIYIIYIYIYMLIYMHICILYWIKRHVILSEY